jgi:predicted DNA-binding transcriptional regulator YafY
MGPAAFEIGREQSGQVGTARRAHASRYPLARLLQLIILLQTERCPNARRLSEICEVSRRTIYRDLAALADAGITVLYRPDRQGYQLARSLFLQPPRMEEREALALLVLCRQGSLGDSLGLSYAANQAVDKLVQSLPEANRTRLMAAAEILGDATPRCGVPADLEAVHEQLLAAVAERRQVRLWIRQSPADGVETTKMAIYRLARIKGCWCLVGRSSWHCRVVVVPVPQIERIVSTADSYSIPPRFNLERFLAQGEPSPVAPYASSTRDPLAHRTAQGG